MTRLLCVLLFVALCAAQNYYTGNGEIKCEWLPPALDPYPAYEHVLGIPTVADLPYDSGPGVREVVFPSYAIPFEGTTDNTRPSTPQQCYSSQCFVNSTIRIVSGADCSQHALIKGNEPWHYTEFLIEVGAHITLVDLDVDGIVELVFNTRSPDYVAALKWDETIPAYKLWWMTDTNRNIAHNSGETQNRLQTHDLDGDGLPEIIMGGWVFNGQTGEDISRQNSPSLSELYSVVDDIDNDGVWDLLARGAHSWNTTTSSWDARSDWAIPDCTYYGVGDFGVPGATVDDFDTSQTDDVQEIICVLSTGIVRVYALDLVGGGTAQRILNLDLTNAANSDYSSGEGRGGPPTTGDFDSDGRLEFSYSATNALRVFDLDCTPANYVAEGCSKPYIRWEAVSQDRTSGQTGSSLFDFNGDEIVDAVYADECYLRIYDGSTGFVMFSQYHTSRTWREYPIIANTDDEASAELMVVNNREYVPPCPEVDPIHAGFTCDPASDTCPNNMECRTGMFNQNLTGLCICSTTADCPDTYRCVADPFGYGLMTCRAERIRANGLSGIRIYSAPRQWSAARGIWHQHSFKPIHITDEARVPPLEEIRTTLTAQLPHTRKFSFRQNYPLEYVCPPASTRDCTPGDRALGEELCDSRGRWGSCQFTGCVPGWVRNGTSNDCQPIATLVTSPTPFLTPTPIPTPTPRPSCDTFMECSTCSAEPGCGWCPSFGCFTDSVCSFQCDATVPTAIPPDSEIWFPPTPTPPIPNETISTMDSMPTSETSMNTSISVSVGAPSSGIPSQVPSSGETGAGVGSASGNAGGSAAGSAGSTDSAAQLGVAALVLLLL